MNKTLIVILLLSFFGCTGTERPMPDIEQTEPEPPVKESVIPEQIENSTEGIEMNEYDYSGSWHGQLNAGAVNILMVFNIEKGDTGYKATMDSPDQAAFGIEISEVLTEGKTITLVSSQVAGKFEGEINKQDLLAGTWFQGGGVYPLVLERKEPVEKVARPQDPAEPYPYLVEDITFPNKSAGINLAGTLTLPEGNGPFTAIVLISGSGPQNRNEELMNHRPFLVISDYLTRNGIAVLRYDDRGIAESEGDFAAATTNDLKSDASAAVDYLAARNDLDISSIGIAGHSEGGMIAPLLAAENEKIKYILMLAGSAFSGEDILCQQTRALLVAQGYNELIAKQNVDLAVRIYQIIKDNPDNETAVSELNKFYKSIGASEEDVAAEVQQMISPWFRNFLTFSSRSALENLSIPVFAANGSLDLQVPADINLQEIESALKKAGNTGYMIKKYDGLNHLFQPAETGLVTEYAQIETTFSETVLEDMKDWILSITE